MARSGFGSVTRADACGIPQPPFRRDATFGYGGVVFSSLMNLTNGRAGHGLDACADRPGGSAAAGLATGVGALPVFFVRTLSPRLESRLTGFRRGGNADRGLLSLMTPGALARTRSSALAALSATPRWCWAWRSGRWPCST